eukprot:TRINITY_DN32635_c0_g2_i2.p1 TRINITY_DN32635_c0_g2~~TRINITY_DN32635_c0_g2_i2.p1  ORF type:complete len:388 (+),score=30.59 TRINITY_DN32635_c0_g2_i2:90-1253(+)
MSQDAGGAAAAVGDELPTCRICFMPEDEGQPLISPCKCEGSQKYVHVSCLQQWQRSVQLSGPSREEDFAKERRHLVCQVCMSEFNLCPQDRGDLMLELAGLNKADVRPGLLMVTKNAIGDSAPFIGMTVQLRAFFEAKAAHFRSAVYILTEEIQPPDDDAANVKVLGVNLSRALPQPDLMRLEGALSDTSLAEYKRSGVAITWMNGGPVQPRTVTAVAIVEHVAPDLRYNLMQLHGIGLRLLEDDGRAMVVVGGLPGVLMLAAQEAELARDRDCDEATVPVLAWAGFAQWGRTQLLNELARGSWGWCRMKVADVRNAIAAHDDPPGAPIFDSLRPSSRLAWAPENDVSREFERRTSAARSRTQEVEDTHAEAVANLVQQFELLRRRR